MIVTTLKRATSNTTIAERAANWLCQQCGDDLEALAGSDPKTLDAVCQFVATDRRVDKVIAECDGSLIAIVALAVSVAQLAQSMRNVQTLTAKRAAWLCRTTCRRCSTGSRGSRRPLTSYRVSSTSTGKRSRQP